MISSALVSWLHILESCYTLFIKEVLTISGILGSKNSLLSFAIQEGQPLESQMVTLDDSNTSVTTNHVNQLNTWCF